MKSKGMSPLVATILLVAFLLAFGLLLTEWILRSSQYTECEMVDAVVTELCKEGQTLRLKGSFSKDSLPVKGLALLTTDIGTEYVVKVANSSVRPGESFGYLIPIPAGAGKTVSVLPVIDDNPRSCGPRPIEKVSELKPC